MKKLLLIVTVLSLGFLSSCSKDDSDDSGSNNGGNTGPVTPTQFFKCKINGVMQEFKSYVITKDDTNFTNYIVVIAFKDLNVKPAFVITLTRKPQGWVSGIKYVMNELEQESYTEFEDGNGFTFKSKNTPANTSFDVTLSEVNMSTNGMIKGAFSGTLQLEENTNQVLISEGSFNIKASN